MLMSSIRNISFEEHMHLRGAKMSSIEKRASQLAFRKHSEIGQIRHGDNSAYINHPSTIVHLLTTFGIIDPEVLSAAWLHDTMEDTNITAREIITATSFDVYDGVAQLTFPDVPKDFNKQAKIQLCLHFIEKINDPWANIKVADIIHNTSSMVHYKLKRAKSYLPEKAAQLNILKEKSIHSNLMLLAIECIKLNTDSCVKSY